MDILRGNDQSFSFDSDAADAADAADCITCLRLLLTAGAFATHLKRKADGCVVALLKHMTSVGTAP